jgi:hypothetical protein
MRDRLREHEDVPDDAEEAQRNYAVAIDAQGQLDLAKRQRLRAPSLDR